MDVRARCTFTLTQASRGEGASHIVGVYVCVWVRVCCANVCWCEVARARRLLCKVCLWRDTQFPTSIGRLKGWLPPRSALRLLPSLRPRWTDDTDWIAAQLLTVSQRDDPQPGVSCSFPSAYITSVASTEYRSWMSHSSVSLPPTGSSSTRFAVFYSKCTFINKKNMF